MANYYATARSNYFKVKDAEAFKKWVDSVPGLGRWEKDGTFALFGDNEDSNGWPGVYMDEDGHEVVFNGIDVADFLTEDSVAIFMEAGAEKMRYITGHAVAVNHEGDVVYVNISEIYELAKEKFGITPTLAEY